MSFRLTRPNARRQKKTAPRALKSPTEKHEQKVYVQWLKLNRIPHFHIPNGGSRGYAREGLSLKQQGVSPGVPDICVPVPFKNFAGLYVELKRVDGVVSDLSQEQIEWIDYLNRVGYYAAVAFGAKNAMKITEKYFDGVKLHEVRYNSYQHFGVTNGETD